jgi:8-oxo-dGTP pyrophosphatase MutT (NUDIX family)
VRKRVVAYVTRERDGATELLVFEHRDHPSAGVQVPAGRADPGETLEQTLRRELHEESGIEDAVVVRELGRPTWPEKYENHAFEVAVDGVDLPDAWAHEVHGKGDDAGLVFLYRWEPVRPDLELFDRRDPILEEL